MLQDHGAQNHGAQSAPRSSIRRHLIAAAAVSALLVGGLGLWAGTTDISGAVVVPGVVVVENNVKKVQHPTGGVIGELRVREGDRVKAGDILIKLDPTQSAVNLAIVAKSIDELLVRQIRLEAERDGEASVSFPAQLNSRAEVDPDFGRVLSGEQKFFELRRASRAGQESQLRERVQQLREQINGVDEQLRSKKLETELIESELKGVRDLYSKNLIPVQRVMALERDRARIGGEHGALVATIAQANARISETELQILQIGQDLRAEVGKELSEIRAKLAEFTERKIAAEDQLRRIDIAAPADGVVHQLAVHTIGGVIAQGEALMLIVPDSDTIIVEARLSPETIDQVRVGQKAVMRFSAFNQRTTPEVNGFLRRISADLATDNRTGASYYIARLEVPESERTRLAQRVIPGMPVEAFIQTGERTVMSYLTKPLSDQMMRAFRER
ncbi:MAG: HlyD family type I secretion periplasmic adaptor subunit [Beijerinckiaceae bacterium]|nr:HlyD family type I secretion periplasmic adaptor subunit [Beijerinckiaceae bacterium]